MARGSAFGDRLRAFARPWELASFFWVPTIVMTFAFWHELRASDALQDFAIFRTAARHVLHGTSPYVAANAHALAGFDKFVYPPASAVFFAPLAIVPAELGRVLILVAALACILVALHLLGVEDWRCYGVAAMSPPAVNSLALGALTSFLLLGTAVAWRYRDRARVSAPVTAVTIVAKLFLWPLAVWLAATRRFRAFAACAVLGAVAFLAGWAAIDFAGLRTYPRMLRILTDLESRVSYGPLGLVRLPSGERTALSLVLMLAVVAATAAAARGADGDRRAFAVAAVGALVATPILWLHYLLLLLVPVALYRPRLSAVWFVPLALWAVPSTNTHGATWRAVLALVVLAVVTLATLGPPALRRTWRQPASVHA
jgi:alpha-1,2-mannosyltransferase